MLKLMFEDEREIEAINDHAAQVTHAVGLKGITKIEVYRERGEMSNVPFLAIWKDGFLWMRTDARNKDVVYKDLRV